jgi:pyruvate kinase
VARFDFSWGDAAYHQETLENLKLAIKATKKLCAVMLDTVGPELQVVNKSEVTISLEENESVVLTPHKDQEASSKLLPINFSGLAKALKPGDTIFVGQYLFTGSETTSVWLEVSEVQGDDVVCVIKNSATLAGSLFTLHCSQIHIDLPTLSDEDKDVMKKWGAPNKIDFLSLSYTRHAEDVRQAREYLSKLGDLSQTLIFAKIENVEGLNHFDEILEEADGREGLQPRFVLQADREIRGRTHDSLGVHCFLCSAYFSPFISTFIIVYNGVIFCLQFQSR